MMSKINTERKPKVFKRLIERDGLTCWICGTSIDPDRFKGSHDEAISIDHYVPRCHGGGHRLENLRLAHRVCNSYRGSPKV